MDARMTRMNQQLYERRLDCLQMYSRGIKPSVFTQELGQKYKVFPDTIWRDWQNRNHWLSLVARMRDPETVMIACVEENNLVKKAAWSLFYNAENDTAKACALKLIVDVNDRILKLNMFGSEGVEAAPFVIKMFKPEFEEVRKDAEASA